MELPCIYNFKHKKANNNLQGLMYYYLYQTPSRLHTSLVQECEVETD